MVSEKVAESEYARDFVPGDDFSVEILKDLISQGYGGDALVVKFCEYRMRVAKAIEIMNQHAEEIAAGTREYYTAADVFGEDLDGE